MVQFCTAALMARASVTALVSVYLCCSPSHTVGSLRGVASIHRAGAQVPAELSL